MAKYFVDVENIGVHMHDLNGKSLPYEQAVEIVERLAKHYPSYNYVYVLHSTATSLYKIGFTSHTAEKRCVEVRSEMKDDTIDVVNSFRYHPNEAGKVEKILQVLLAPYNVNGEWFDLPDVYIKLFRSTVDTLPWYPYNSLLLYDLLFTWLYHELEHSEIDNQRLRAWLKMAHSLLPVRRHQLHIQDVFTDEEWSKWETWMCEAMNIISNVENGHHDST